MPVLVVKNLSFSYREAPLFHRVSFELKEGTLASLLGDNGSGKSTLLKLVFGLLSPLSDPSASPSINLYGREIQRSTTRQRLKLGLAYLPQKDAPFGRLTVKENLEVVLSLHPKRDRARNLERTLELLRPLPLRLKQLAGTLSGGEARIVGLAMCLAANPKVLLLDEPLAGLSNERTEAVGQLFSKLLLSRTTLLIAEHRQSALEAVGESVRLQISDGKLEHAAKYSNPITQRSQECENFT